MSDEVGEPVAADATGGRMGWAEVFRLSRPTYLYTRLVNQRLGAVVGVVGVARGWRPAAVSLAALGLSLLTSAVVLVSGGGLLPAVVATLGWQLAYTLDCADGQVARASGRTSAAGAALDLYADAVGRLAMTVALVASVAQRGMEVPGPWIAVLTGGLLATLFHEAAQQLEAVEAAAPSRLREAIGVLRDPGVLALLPGLSLLGGPGWTVAAMGYIAALGGAQLGVRFLRLTVAAWRA